MIPPAIRKRIWILLLGIPFAAVVAVVITSGVPELQRSGDGALLEFSTRSTASLETMTGPYSRFGFHHPGPAYFLARIPLYYIFGMAGSADYLTVCLICILCILATSKLISRASGTGGAAVFCTLSAYFMLSTGPHIWLSDWNPFIVIFPLAMTFTALAAAAAGDGIGLPAAALSGSFAVQTHIGCLPSVAAAFALALFHVLRRSGRSGIRKNGRLLLQTSLVLVLMWLPVMLSGLTQGGGGNPGEILSFMRRVRPEIGPVRALAVWTDSVSGMEGFLLPARMLRMEGLLIEAKALLVAVRLALLFLCLRLTGGRPLMRMQRMLCSMALLLHAVTLVSVYLVRGEPHAYLFTWFSAVGLLSWTAISLTAVSVADMKWRPALRKWSVIPALCLLALLSVLNTAAVWKGDRSAPGDPLGLDDPVIADLLPPISRVLAEYSGERFLIVPSEHELWPVMVGLLNGLDREGHQVALPDEFAFMTGLPPGPVSGELHILRSGTARPVDMEVLYYSGDLTAGLIRGQASH